MLAHVTVTTVNNVDNTVFSTRGDINKTPPTIFPRLA
jgi:hypothetical protein